MVGAHACWARHGSLAPRRMPAPAGTQETVTRGAAAGTQVEFTFKAILISSGFQSVLKPYWLKEFQVCPKETNPELN